MIPKNFLSVCEPIGAISDAEKSRLAEAACYAVLGRVLPILRHDVAGSLQPVQTLVIMLQRRVQSTNPDLAAITKNVMALSVLAKQAADDCMSALWWTDSIKDIQVSLRVGVDETARLLTREMSLSALSLVNDITDDLVTAMQSTFRTVFMGALLAFCDRNVADNTLQATFHDASPGANTLDN